MNALKKIDEVLNRFNEYVMLITGTAVTLMILINALFRVIKVDWFGSEELTLIVGVWLYFIGSIYAARKKTHIAGDMVDMFVEDKRIVWVCDLIKLLVSIAMAAVFFVWCFQFVQWQFQLGAQTAVYKVPNWIQLLPIPIFFFMWVVYQIRDLVVLIAEGPRGLIKAAKEKKAQEQEGGEA